MSQTRLSELTGIDRPTLSRYCNGVLRPTPDKLAAICQHISPDAGPRAELIVAHLRDELEELRSANVPSSLINIGLSSDTDGANPLVVPATLQDIFSPLIRDAARAEFQDLRELLRCLGRVINNPEDICHPSLETEILNGPTAQEILEAEKQARAKANRPQTTAEAGGHN
jgi:transcriptional regulator with XRE-family HTH domain